MKIAKLVFAVLLLTPFAYGIIVHAFPELFGVTDLEPTSYVLFTLILLVPTFIAAFDIIRRDDLRGVPAFLWLLAVIVGQFFGAVVYIAINYGRETRKSVSRSTASNK